ncbi:MAG: YchJ family protein [Chloroflexi bacterium]|nr:YchJ family protein [Chloroflexota bacterium]
MSQAACPCGSGKTGTDCCAPFLTGQAKPTSPEQLMRSRYSAFCTGNIDYLIATHHPSQRTAADRETLAQTMAETQWLALRVLHTDESQIAAGVGVVEFVAFYKNKGVFGQLHEKSEFIRQSDRWYYLKGVLLAPIKLDRNDPCWCGSGKKYKRCHGSGE